eukprot:4330934-Pleurochrysis_carterae.AAC.1
MPTAVADGHVAKLAFSAANMTYTSRHRSLVRTRRAADVPSWSSRFAFPCFAVYAVGEMPSVNKRVRVECVGLCVVCAGNELGPHGLDALAEALKSNTSLTELDVSCACDACFR